MTTTVKILGIAGSLREKSHNKALLRAAGTLLPEGASLETFDLAPIPPYNDDLLTHGFPEPVKTLRDKISAADALLFATPEYNYSLPGVLKNAIDWASRPPRPIPFNDKPIAIMGASGGASGTLRAQYHLRQVAVFLDMHPINKPEVFIRFANEKIDQNGNVTDQETLNQIKALLEALATWTRRLRGE